MRFKLGKKRAKQENKKKKRTPIVSKNQSNVHGYRPPSSSRRSTSFLHSSNAFIFASSTASLASWFRPSSLDCDTAAGERCRRCRNFGPGTSTEKVLAEGEGTEGGSVVGESACDDPPLSRVIPCRGCSSTLEGDSLDPDAAGSSAAPAFSTFFLSCSSRKSNTNDSESLPLMGLPVVGSLGTKLHLALSAWHRSQGLVGDVLQTMPLSAHLSHWNPNI